MKIFHEIYGNYFRIVSEILSLPEITESKINDIISKYGFRDTMLFLPQKFTQNKDGWGLLKKTGSKFIPVIKNKPAMILTEIQKRWLKAKLYEPEINLFINNDVLSALKKRLENVKPLYDSRHFMYTDRFSDGDDFSDVDYQKNFRTVMNAVRNHEVLEITFRNKCDKQLTGYYIPLKIQYSPKNNRFRMFASILENGISSGNGIINIGRIIQVRKTGELWNKNISMEEYLLQRRCREPVTVCISDERNATERFFMEFAPYEKRAEFDLISGKCTIKLWYDYQEETELLIRLLGFGSVLEIVSPPDFRRKARERITRQYQLLNENCQC